LKPQPDKRLGAAKAMVNTAAGYYESGWKYDGDDVIYTFVVPFDAEAEVILTDKNGEAVKQTLTAGTHTFTL
jgi:alpha-L-rhamnosidase